MKKNLILFPLIGVLLYLTLSSYNYGPGAGGLGDRTGASGTTGCAGGGCHASSSTSSSVISIQVLDAGTPVCSYVGSHSYTIKITATNTGSTTLPACGFQLAVVGTGTTTNEGTLSPITNTHLGTYSGINIVEHSTPLAVTTGTGGTGSTYVISIPWTSPATGTGSLTIFTVVNEVNLNGAADAGDLWNNTTLVINENLASITGTTNVCQGSTTTLSDATTGGTWSSGSTGIATVGTSTGIVTGIAPGTASIIYTTPCASTTAIVTVLAAPASISGTTTFCSGSSTNLTDLSGAGTWTSSNTSVATIGTSGTVSGVSAGSSLITFVLNSSGCRTVSPVTVNSTPSPITGPTTACIGATGFLSDVTGGGTWSSSNTAVVSIGSAGVTATGSGTAIITYSIASGCYTTQATTVNPLPPAITGTTSVCQGFSTTLSDGSGTGTWSSSNIAVAQVVSGLVNGISSGSAVITYTLPGAGCISTTTYLVNPVPPSITGTFNTCVANSTTLSDGLAGGTWSSPGSSSILTVGSGTGLVSGITAGTAIISYVMPTGCNTSALFQVYPQPSVITGTPAICTGASTSLNDADGGGGWTSSNTLVANVDFSLGTLTGVSAGTATITYTLITGCYTLVTATVNPLPFSITGASSVCAGSSVTLNDLTGGGTWISNNTATAIIGSSTGIVTGVSSGTVTLSYKLPTTGCYTTSNEVVNPLPGSISGASTVCVGSTTNLTDGIGTWSSGNTTIASIGSASGTLLGVSAGTASITFRLSSTGCKATTVETVNSLPSGITGVNTVCAAGGTTNLSDFTGGGVWTSSNSNATIGSASGFVTGVSTGTSEITYSVASSGCYVTGSVIINPVPAAITGVSALCQGTTASFSDISGAGTWTSNNTVVATIGSGTGNVSGVSGGTCTISYTFATGCASIKAVTVNPLPNPITGTFSVCQSFTTTLSDIAGGGTWSSSNTAIASIGSASGAVTGMTAGTAMITYKLTTGCFVTQVMRVNPMSPITGLSSLCSGLSATLSDGTGGGTWSSSNTAVVTIGSVSGFVTGISAGSATITYSLSTGCLANSVINIVSGPSAITGNTNICTGMTSALTDAGGGTWSSSGSGTASVGSTGVVTGVTTGTATISYSLGTGCTVTIIVTVSPSPASITGASVVCQGSTINLNDITTLGSWSSGNADAAVGSTGIVTGISGGSSIISYTLGTGCMATKVVTINPLPSIISGPGSVCTGSTIILMDSISGGTWTSSRIAIATIGSLSGSATGIATGTTIISYIPSTGCGVSALLTVNPLPSSIFGGSSVCTGSSTTLTDLGTGSWSSSNSNATIGTSGLLSGISAGTVIITFTLSSGCYAIKAETVNPTPGIYSVTGGGSYCAGTGGVHIGLLGSDIGISYQLYNGSLSSGGPITGGGTSIDFGLISVAGTYTVTATNISTGCQTNMTDSAVISINPLPGPITGATSVCAGLTTSLSDTSTGGTWNTSSALITIGSSSGVVTGISAGTTVVTFALSTGCQRTVTITVNPVPAAISGVLSVCAGSSTAFTDASTGGEWTSTSTGIATAGSLSGSITGISAGTATIIYTLATGCSTSTGILVNPVPAAISGPVTECVGSSITLLETSSGGIWTSGNIAVATVGTSSGVVAGIAGGTAMISYSYTTGCYANKVVTINPLPDSITGPTVFCPRVLNTEVDTTIGGTWSSSNIAVVTIGSSSGTVNGIIPGSAILTYTLSTGCFVTRHIAINPNPIPGIITGPTSQCMGSNITLADTASGGTWSSTNTAIATVGSTGIVSPVSPGIATIDYTVTNFCGSLSIGSNDTVIILPTVDSLLGADSVCQGDTIHLLEGVVTGVWSSSNTASATVDVNGVVTGVAAGTTLISFTLTTPCGSATASLLVTVKTPAQCFNNVPTIPVSGTLSVYPNPSGGTFEMALPATDKGAIITISDVTGKEVAQKIITGTMAQTVTIQLNNISSGSYFIKVNAGDIIYRQKIEIIR